MPVAHGLHRILLGQVPYAEREVGIRTHVAHVSEYEISCTKRLAHTDLTTISSTRGCETLPCIERWAHVSSWEISYARSAMRPHPISVPEPAHDEFSAVDQPPSSHDLPSGQGSLSYTRSVSCVKRKLSRST